MTIKVWKNVARRQLEGVLAEAEVTIDEGPYAGLVVRGFEVISVRGRLEVVPPHKVYTSPAGKRRYPFVKGGEGLEYLNCRILEEYRGLAS